jgi:hypothetical protein
MLRASLAGHTVEGPGQRPEPAAAGAVTDDDRGGHVYLQQVARRYNEPAVSSTNH